MKEELAQGRGQSDLLKCPGYALDNMRVRVRLSTVSHLHIRPVQPTPPSPQSPLTGVSEQCYLHDLKL